MNPPMFAVQRAQDGNRLQLVRCLLATRDSVGRLGGLGGDDGRAGRVRVCGGGTMTRWHKVYSDSGPYLGCLWEVWDGGDWIWYAEDRQCKVHAFPSAQMAWVWLQLQMTSEIAA